MYDSQNVAFGDYARPAGGPPTPLASLARTPTLLAPLALSPPAKCALQTGLNWPR